MAKIWSWIVPIALLPVVFAHYLLWPPCKENEESILEPGFLIYGEMSITTSPSQKTFDIKLFLRDCRFRVPKPKTAYNYTISKGTYLATEHFSMKDVEQFVKNCNNFEIIEFYDGGDKYFDVQSLMWYETIPEPPRECTYSFTKRIPFLEAIREINLSRNKIQLMGDPEMFAALKNLQTLNLASNMIENMHVGVFKTLSLIKNLILSRNIIRIFPGKLFQDLNKLEEVDLSYNFIESVPEQAFRGTALEKLNLSYNKLKHLPSNFLLNIRSEGTGLKIFYFECNPWYCGCLKDILVELKEMSVHYNSDRLNGVNLACFLKTPRNFECDRQLNKENESNHCT